MKEKRRTRKTAKSIRVVVVTRLLPRDGVIKEDNGAPEAGQLPRAWTGDCRETESHQRVGDTKSS